MTNIILKKLQSCAFFCEKCNFKTNNKKDYRRHGESQKHLKNNGDEIICKDEAVEKKIDQWENKVEEDTLKLFHCDHCMFETNNKNHYHRHLDSLKHIKKQEEIDKWKKNYQDFKQKKYDAMKEQTRKEFEERKKARELLDHGTNEIIDDIYS
jgi:hypothetical protein